MVAKVRKIPKQKVDYDRLGAAILRSHYVLNFAREKRKEAVQEFVGFHYSENGAPERVPVNLIAAYVEIIGRSLVSQCPRFLLSTFESSAKPIASAMMQWVNDKLEAMDFQESLHRCAVDSLFPGFGGIMKVGIASPADSEARGHGIKSGEVFAESVDFDDFVYDIHCKRIDQATYYGHRYRVPLDSIKGSSLYDGTKDLEADPDDMYNRAGDEQISAVGETVLGKTSEFFKDFVTLWEIYLPAEKRIITIADQHLGDGKVIRDVEWIGPSTGPYIFLHYDPVPGNAMPKAPMHDLIDLHIAFNALYNKLIRQGERQKENFPVKSVNSEDAEKWMAAGDGEMFQCEMPQDFKPIKSGGADVQNEAFTRQLKEAFSWRGGNLDIQGGLSPQAKTLGQDKMLNANSSRQTANMQEAMTRFTSKVGKAMCWWWYHDPNKEMSTHFDLPGLPEFSVPRKITPEQRQQANFDDLKIVVDPYSMQYSTPQERGQQLTQLVTQMLAPMMGLLQQQGVSIDMNSLLSKLAVYMNMPDLVEIINVQEPPQTEDGGSQPPGATGGAAAQGAAMPSSTSRTYNRVSTSGQTPGGQAANAMDRAAGLNKGGNPGQGGVQR